MLKLQISKRAWADLRYLLQHDRRLLDRAVRIIEECQRDPFQGIGKPEPLKGDLQGLWSRRIDQKNRLLYEVEGGVLIIHAMCGHYDD
jgi:toxin YoeB